MLLTFLRCFLTLEARAEYGSFASEARALYFASYHEPWMCQELAGSGFANVILDK